MLKTGIPIEARIKNFGPKLDGDGGKWFNVRVSVVLGDSVAVQTTADLADAFKFLKKNGGAEGVPFSGTMEGVRLAMGPIGASSPDKIIDSTTLFKFVLSREKSSKAGTIRKEASGRVTISFTFSVLMNKLKGWLEEKYGNLINIVIEKSQTELQLTPADGSDNPDSQTARNARILDEEIRDAKPAKGKSKKGAAKKADKAPKAKKAAKGKKAPKTDEDAPAGNVDEFESPEDLGEEEPEGME